MAVIPGEVVRRAVAPTMTPAATPRPAGANPIYSQRASAGPMATDVSSGSRPGNPGYGSYTLQPDPARLARIVASDPNVMAAQMNYNTGAAQADAALRGLVSTNIAQYGDPQVAQDMGLTVDPHTLELARSNTLAGHSTLALLNLAAAHAADQMYTHLANTGLLHSGEVGFEQGLNAASDSLSRYKALTSLQDTLSTGITTDVNAKQTLQDKLDQAIYNAKVSGNMPGPTHVTVGSVPPTAAPHLGGSTGLAPGTYTNMSAGLPNYQPTPGYGSSLGPGTYTNVSAGLPSYKPVGQLGGSYAPGTYTNVAGAMPHYVSPV